MTKNYQIDFNVKDATTWDNVFSESYKIALWKKFVDEKRPKEHGLKNHVEGFLVQLKKNCTEATKGNFTKRQIYVVSYGMNTGSEINGERPALVYKDSGNTLWEDVIVIPLTTALQDKQADKFDVYVGKDDKNSLFQNSYARLRQIRSVSVKRIGKLVGTLADEKIKSAINAKMKEMLGTEA